MRHHKRVTEKEMYVHPSNEIRKPTTIMCAAMSFALVENLHTFPQLLVTLLSSRSKFCSKVKQSTTIFAK